MILHDHLALTGSPVPHHEPAGLKMVSITESEGEFTEEVIPQPIYSVKIEYAYNRAHFKGFLE
jgi:hypothetical protein